MRFISILFSFVVFPYFVLSQNTGIVSGNIIDRVSQQPISGASIQILGFQKAILSDSVGQFRITGVKVGSYSIQITALGYDKKILYNIPITSGNENNFVIELDAQVSVLQGVTVVTGNKKSARAATLETPLSVQRLTTEEIKSNPGGNFDVSRVIQALPGVGGTGSSAAGFRNDIIIRGGAPNENVYYLDGIEIPVINHFSTQGSAGGPTGMLNVSFLEDVKLSSSAFDARYGNALSSVFEFKQKRGNENRLQGNIRLSATELAATFDGPLSKDGKTTFLASARRSYLQVLFKLIDLPIRPNFWDFQYKVNHRIDKKTTLTLLGVGAIDEFSFAAPKKATPEKLYALNSNPGINQWNYTVGAAIKRLINNGFWNLSISRNDFNNSAEKYENNLGPVKGLQTLNYTSRETENKLRFDVNKNRAGWKYSFGLQAEWVNYSNQTFQIIRPAIKDNAGVLIQPAVTFQYNTSLQMAKWGGFFQTGKRFFENRLGINLGVRTDMNSFTSSGSDPLKTLSPRISLSYVLADKFTLNASVGTYYKVTPYTSLGFKNAAGDYVNKGSDYLRSTHYVAGIEYLPSDATRFTFETFFKQYAQVAVNVKDGISLSNLGGDFNVLGNEPITTSGTGSSYGFEFFAQQKLTKRFFGIFSYTYFNSQYSNRSGTLIPSSWDNRHLVSIIMGYKFNRNWELGLKFRYQGGVPSTPYDEAASRLNFLTLGSGILDYSKLNSQRLQAFNASDIRIDKKWNYKRTTLDLYLDITNWYLAKSPAPPFYSFKRTADNSGFQTTDNLPIQQNGSNAIPFYLNNADAIFAPTIGFIVEF
ncbi:MAG: carboxypeptidase regulatory-like domain-containing protein [Chitinophagia bacterium]|jgi:outer membrane receptor for ferrienterochelin and colicin